MTDDPRPPPPVIRPLEAVDRPDWLVLWRGYQRFYAADIPEAATSKTFARLLDPAEPVFGALALDGGRPVGLVHYIFHRSTWSEGDYCYLQDLFIAEAVRGGGLGRALIEFVYGQAASAGAARVYWLTHETNATAMRLYDQVAERSGFVQYRRQLG